MAVAKERNITRCKDIASFENYDLPKSLGNQLNANVLKYDQWQRRERTTKPHILTEKKKDTKVTFKVGTINRTALKHFAPTSVSRSRRAQAKFEEDKRKQQEIIDTLTLKIKQSKQTTDLYRKRSKELVEINLDVVKEIESQEHETHAEVKRLLRKYEKFRGSIATLNSNFAREISEVRHELEETKRNIQKKIEALEQQVENKDKKLLITQEELQVLHNYKDKEYPVKALVIAQLHGELESVKTSSQEDEEELKHIITTELGKYDKEKLLLANGVTCRVTEESVALMHPSLKDMALQNMLMKKEIELHKTRQKDLIQSNNKLAEEVATLLSQPKSYLRLHLYPELFIVREKCEPDVELDLDITKQDWLPL